jgi:hypothetical protein
MADDLAHPDDRPDPAARFRADLAGSLRGLSGRELAGLLVGLPDQVKVDLIAELAARGPASARLPDTWPGHPDAEFLRRRSLREVVADRRDARAARRLVRHPAPPWLTGLPTAPPSPGPPATRPFSGGSGRRWTVALPSAPTRTSGRRSPSTTQAARAPKPPAQGWRDWWLPNDQR